MKLPRRHPFRLWHVLAAGTLLAPLLGAQQVSLPTTPPQALPEAPSAESLPESREPQAQAGQAGKLVALDGTLLAGPNDAIAGATLTVVDAAGKRSEAISNQAGAFHFEALAPGRAILSVSAESFAARTLAINLPAGALTITVTPAVVTADVQVTASEQEIGAAQIEAESKQRVLGLFPNYYVVYAGNVVPMRPKQKFALATRFAFDPVSIGVTGVFAGVEQATNAFSGYGQGAQGYFKRFGAGLADGVDSTFLSGAILPVLFHQDPRYFYKGTGSVGSRVLYAAEFVVRTRDDHGRWRPNYSLLLGNLGSGAISNAYYPASNRHGAGLTFENAVIGTAFGAVGNILEELVLKHVTPNLPSYQPNGIPEKPDGIPEN